MRRLFTISFVLLVTAACAYAQGKGVDPQNERVRDTGSQSTPGSNGTKQDTGAGRGIDFGKGRTPEVPLIPNPYRFTARRDVLMQAVTDLIRDRKMILDDAVSKTEEGMFVTQPYTFTRGAVVAQSELNRYANLPPTTARGWTRGRYTLIIEVQAIDGVSANVAVTAKVEGRTDGATGAEWSTLPSTGTAEQEFLGVLIERVTGSAPPGVIIPSEP
ncbi:MAG: hypothetical protein JO360_04890 [Acidobacteria bacterium]|nr:hypothetical protein [Acidobacteriota bacterium]